MLKLMLYETIHKDNFQRNTAFQCWNNVATIRNNVVMLCCTKNRHCKLFRVTHTERFTTTVFSATQRCNIGTMSQPFKTMLNHDTTLCCAKNRRCKSSRVTLKRETSLLHIFLWRDCRMCSPKILLLVSLFAFIFFTAAHFHPAGRQHFLFSHCRYENFHVFHPRKFVSS